MSATFEKHININREVVIDVIYNHANSDMNYLRKVDLMLFESGLFSSDKATWEHLKTQLTILTNPQLIELMEMI